MSKLTLDEADRIADGVLRWGRQNQTGRLTVAVLDTGGHPIVVKRDDGSEYLRVDIAIAKAWGALGMGLPSRLIGERVAAKPEMAAFFTSLASVSGGRVVPVAGGVLIRREHEIVGGLGVSGDVSHVDEEAAVAAIEAVGLQADIGQREEWRRP